MTEPAFDLQSHSLYSDGALAPAEVVRRAAAAGVTVLALTDHDSTAGVAEALEAAEDAGIRVVAAAELSTIDEHGLDLHVVGYLLDPAEPDLVAALAQSRGDRERRAVAMADRLRELGFAVDDGLIAGRTDRGLSVGRPHLAQAVTGHPDNAARLQEAGLTDPTDFLVAYLTEDRPAFVGRSAPSVREAIDLIHGAGGVAVWAHPFWDIDAGDEVLATLDHFRDLGLDGVEAFYPTHTEAQTRMLAARGSELDLLLTGSSDFHGPDHSTFSTFRAFETYGLAPRLGPIAG